MSTAPMAKLGAMRTPTRGSPPSCSRSVVEALLRPAGGADDDVHTLRDAVRDVGRRRVGHRELDDDVGAGEVAQVVALVEAADELEVGGVLDRAAHGGAHPAARADDRDPRRAHATHPSQAPRDPPDTPVRSPSVHLACAERVSLGEQTVNDGGGGP